MADPSASHVVEHTLCSCSAQQNIKPSVTLCMLAGVLHARATYLAVTQKQTAKYIIHTKMHIQHVHILKEKPVNESDVMHADTCDTVHT